MKDFNLLIGVTGSMGATSFLNYLLPLIQKYPNTQVVLTESASHFISRGVLKLYLDGVYQKLFPLSQLEKTHIELARWADLITVFPASANILSQAAHGIATSLLSTTLLAHEHPIIFFPNMDLTMWKNSAVQRNVALLKSDGHKILDPIERTGYTHFLKKFDKGSFMHSPEQLFPILESTILERKAAQSLKNTLLKS